MMTVQQYRSNRVNWTQTFTIFIAAILGCLAAMGILMFLGRYLMKRQIEATVKELEHLAPPAPSIAGDPDDDDDDDDFGYRGSDDDDDDDDDFGYRGSDDDEDLDLAMPGGIAPESQVQLAEEPADDNTAGIQPEVKKVSVVKAKATKKSSRKQADMK